MIECAILVGLPASGKTTFYRERLASTHVHISKDNWPDAQRKGARQSRAIDEALSHAQSIAVDNTNPTVEDRRAIIEQARAHGVRVVGYYFEASTREAVGRNRGRTGKQRVPDIAIFATAKRMVEPHVGEGFDELYRVSIVEGDGFNVQRVDGPVEPAS
jgi:predicted kinase